MPAPPVFVYVVMSYRDPELVLRLVGALLASSPRAHVVLRHDDRRCPLPSGLPVSGRLHPRPSSAQLEWGAWSMVEAMLVELRWVRDNLDASHVAFISGQDYPARDLGAWELECADSDAVLTARQLEFVPRWGRRRGYRGSEDYIRYLYRWYGLPVLGRGRRGTRTVERLLARFCSNVRPLLYFRVLPHGRGALLGFRRLQTPFGDSAPCYKGWPWMVLSARAVHAVLAAAERDVGLVRLYRRSLIPEESFLQTVVLNDPSLRCRLDEISYSDWAGAGAHPAVLTARHAQAIEDSGTAFARKVELVASHDLLLRLDARRGAGSTWDCARRN